MAIVGLLILAIFLLRAIGGLRISIVPSKKRLNTPPVYVQKEEIVEKPSPPLPKTAIKTKAPKKTTRKKVV